MSGFYAPSWPELRLFSGTHAVRHAFWGHGVQIGSILELINFGPFWLIFGSKMSQNSTQCAILAKFGPKWAKFGPNLDNLAGIWPSKFGSFLKPNLGMALTFLSNLAIFCQIWQIGPNLAKIGQILGLFRRFRLNLDQFLDSFLGQIWLKIGRIWLKFGPSKSGDFGPK